MHSILVVSKNKSTRKALEESLHSDYEIKLLENKDLGFQELRNKRYEFLFIDAEILLDSEFKNDYKKLLQPLWNIYPTLAIIVITPNELIRHSVMVVKAGANNYLTYPINTEELKYITEAAYDSQVIQSELDYFRDQFWRKDNLELMQTRSPLMQKVYEKVKSVALTKSTVLLSGETGTGKGVLANIIHQHSNRRDNQFISVHCGAIPDTLLESELFGHEKGAFTGAVRRKLGKFEIAKGGTIFLDEVGTITPSAQIKLLQVLQDNLFQRVGGEINIEADVRVIAASNIGLKLMSDEGQFRKDLYYRLNVFPIEIPPLRERTEDIPFLVKFFLKKMNQFNLKEIHDVHPQVMEAFRQYPWPGNIRELENLIERAYILERSHTLSSENLPAELFEFDTLLQAQPVEESITLESYRRRAIENIETIYLKQVLAENKGRMKESATVAGLSTRQLYKLMKKYGLRKEAFKLPPISSNKKEP